MKNNHKISFFLMTQKGYAVLQASVSEIGADKIGCVIGARDSSVKRDYYAEISGFCLQNHIAFFDRGDNHPVNGYAFAISWRWLIPDSSSLIVLHDSLLPKYRGFAPLPTALIKGEKHIGLTALFANREFDRGDIIGQRKIKIQYPLKVQEAIELISRQYAELVVEISKKIISGKKIIARKQREEGASYSLWRSEDDYRIDWSKSASYIKRFIDSVGYPYKGASSFLENRLVRISEADVQPDVKVEDRMAGKVIFMRDGFPVVVCGQGLLKITSLTDDKTGTSLLPLKKFRSRFV
jgi:methionyl-tRNA formyltransferase